MHHTEASGRVRYKHAKRSRHGQGAHLQFSRASHGEREQASKKVSIRAIMHVVININEREMCRISRLCKLPCLAYTAHTLLCSKVEYCYYYYWIETLLLVLNISGCAAVLGVRCPPTFVTTTTAAEAITTTKPLKLADGQTTLSGQAEFNFTRMTCGKKKEQKWVKGSRRRDCVCGSSEIEASAVEAILREETCTRACVASAKGD